jgi:hypothetical protein
MNIEYKEEKVAAAKNHTKYLSFLIFKRRLSVTRNIAMEIASTAKIGIFRLPIFKSTFANCPNGKTTK